MSIATLPFGMPAEPDRPRDFIDLERGARDRRIAEWAEEHQAETSYERWLVGRAASASLDLDRLESAEEITKHWISNKQQ